MAKKYIAVEWPESQYFMGKKGVCFDADKNIWFVPEETYEKAAVEAQNSEFEYGHNIDSEARQ